MRHPLATTAVLGLMLLAPAVGAATSIDGPSDGGTPKSGATTDRSWSPGLEDEAGRDAAIDPDQARREAKALLGRNEADLPADVVVARRGEETLQRLMDIRWGRITVELDDADGTGFRVGSVGVELAGCSPSDPCRWSDG